MAVTAASGVAGKRPVTRLRRLEDERWLAFALLVRFAREEFRFQIQPLR